MEEVDTSTFDIDESGIGRIAAMLGDSTKRKQTFNEMFDKFRQAFANIKVVTTVQNGRKDNTINVAMNTVDDSVNMKELASALPEDADKFMKSLMKGNMLRGTLYKSGKIESFYTKNDQKNLLALMFELPGIPVKVGDKWGLSVSLISMDNNFICDTSYKKNEVSLISLNNVGGQTIAVLKYDIEEYVSGVFSHPMLGEPSPTTMRMKVDITAGFSVEKGQWLYYDGMMSLYSTGFMKSKSNKKISLLPI